MHYYKLKSSEHRSAEFDSASPTNSSLCSCQVTVNSCQGKHPKAPEVCTVVLQICPKTAYPSLRSTTNAVAIYFVCKVKITLEPFLLIFFFFFTAFSTSRKSFHFLYPLDCFGFTLYLHLLWEQTPLTVQISWTNLLSMFGMYSSLLCLYFPLNQSLHSHCCELHIMLKSSHIGGSSVQYRTTFKIRCK